MKISFTITSVKDLQKVAAIIGDYGNDCEEWRIAGVLWPKDMED